MELFIIQNDKDDEYNGFKLVLNLNKDKFYEII